MAVAVEVGRDAAVPLDGDVRVRAGADVHELPVHVVEERAARQAAVRLPVGDVGVGVRVDDEEVEPAVVVVVEPAEAAAHHRLGVVRHAEAERALPEVEPDLLRRDVDELDAGEAACRGPRASVR